MLEQRSRMPSAHLRPDDRSQLAADAHQRTVVRQMSSIFFTRSVSSSEIVISTHTRSRPPHHHSTALPGADCTLLARPTSRTACTAERRALRSVHLQHFLSVPSHACSELVRSSPLHACPGRRHLRRHASSRPTDSPAPSRCHHRCAPSDPAAIPTAADPRPQRALVSRGCRPPPHRRRRASPASPSPAEADRGRRFLPGGGGIACAPSSPPSPGRDRSELTAPPAPR